MVLDPSAFFAPWRLGVRLRNWVYDAVRAHVLGRRTWKTRLTQSRQGAKNAEGVADYDGNVKHRGLQAEGLTPLRRLARSARREKSRFKRLGLMPRASLLGSLCGSLMDPIRGHSRTA